MNMKKWICIMTALCLLFGLSVSLTACREEKPENSTQTEETEEAKPMAYTIEVLNKGGVALEGVGVYVYTDETQQELVWFAKTDAAGAISFNDVESSGYIAVLSGVPEGYEVEETYPVTGEKTVITLEGDISMDMEQGEITFQLGDTIGDFSVTTPEGSVYQLSELLKEKKAVVLNFWYVQCQPCRNEFPYLQEAYELYGKDIEILAMNPVNADNEEIAQFQEELGLTFPMAAVDSKWEKMMDLSAYPTTVVIDRYGVITMIHEGSVTEAQPFINLFGYMVREDYKTELIEKLEDLPEVSVEDTAVYNNPTEVGGVSSFQVTVKAGETVYVDIYKVQNLYFQINSANAFVVYNGYAYYPSGGSVGLIINAPDTFTPVKVGIGNTGSKTETFTATMGQFQGTMGNPYSLTLGEFTASVSANNDQGVYFSYIAPADGELVMTCLQATGGIDYDFVLYNLNSYAYRTKGTEGTADDNGRPVVKVSAKKGQKIQFSVGTLPDSSNTYPAGNFTFLAEFKEGADVQQEEEKKLIRYTITATDENRKPLSGVFFNIQNGSEVVRISTDENGVAATKLVAGTYPVTLVTPAGYEVYTTDFILTEEMPAFSVKLDCVIVVEKTYSVKVVDDTGAPVSGVLVAVGTEFGYTDETGTVSFLLEQGQYSAMILPPEGYTSDSGSYNFGDQMTEITITLKPEQDTDSTETTAPGESTDPSDATDPSDPTENPDPEEPENNCYSVKVTDYNGNPKTGVVVQLFQNGTMVKMIPVDSKGVAQTDFTEGEYTVKLGFSGETLYYEESTAVLNAAAPHLTVKVAAEVSGEPVELYVGDAYELGVGGTYVKMQSNVVNYYLFIPTVAGNYKLTTSDPQAVISFWGGSTAFISDMTASTDYKDNAFTLNVKESYIGATYIIGVTGAENCIVEIIRQGDPILDESDFPLTEYTGTKTVTKIADLPSGKTLHYMDLTAATDSIKLVLNETDGYYHLNTATGPLVYMNLGKDAPYISVYNMMGLSGVGGTSFTQSFYDDGELVKRENYTKLIISYAENREETYGLYPLTEDLKYMIQQGGDYKGWWDSEDPNYVFQDVENLNVELAWMFACCYID